MMKRNRQSGLDSITSSFRIHHFIISRLWPKRPRTGRAGAGSDAWTAKLRLLLEITRKISRSLNLEEVLAQVMDTLD